jgi:hypothetical protein
VDLGRAVAPSCERPMGVGTQARPAPVTLSARSSRRSGKPERSYRPRTRPDPIPTSRFAAGESSRPALGWADHLTGDRAKFGVHPAPLDTQARIDGPFQCRPAFRAAYREPHIADIATLGGLLNGPPRLYGVGAAQPGVPC